MKTALVFPGQGSQAVGMGKELAERYACARAVFDEVDAALGEKLSTLMFEGPAETLTLTENAQPAIMACSIAAFRVLQEQCGLDLARDVAFVAGHSLGEYSALCAAGALTLEQTARLLRVRGKAMQLSVPPGKGAMAALLGADYDTAQAIVEEARHSEVCTIANDNSAGQIVISGSKTAIERAIEIAKAKGVKRAILLDVSAPFHCPLMAPAAGVMEEALGATEMNNPLVPLVANVTAHAAVDAATIKRQLVDQVTGVVRWRESVEYMSAQGVRRFIEVGNGKVLSGLIKRIAAEAETVNVGTVADVEAYRTSLAL